MAGREDSAGGQAGAAALVEAIMDQSPQVRFAAVTDLGGRIVAGILRSGGIPLGQRRESETFCRRAARHRRMRGEFDESLGRVSYVHVERETATQLAVYHPEFTVCLTMEPEAPIGAKSAMVERVREMAGAMLGGGGGGGASRRPSAPRTAPRRRRAGAAQ